MSHPISLKKFAGIKGELMKRRGWWMPVILAAVMVAVTIPNASFAQQKKLVLWTHWEQNPEFNKWYADQRQRVRQEDRLRGRGGHHPVPGIRGQVPRGASWPRAARLTCSWG